MNVGPMSGVVGSAAGAPLSQTAGSETERAQKDSSAHQRQVEKDKKAADAAGIGQTEEDQGTSERDADGRRFWEANGEKQPGARPPTQERAFASSPRILPAAAATRWT